MAGIGFELRRLVQKRTLSGLLGAAISGALIVSGPWIVSAASIAVAQHLPVFSAASTSLAFSGAMVWALAISLIATSAPLYIFVRLSADLIYEGRRGEASSLLLKFGAVSFAISLPPGLILGYLLAGHATDAPRLAIAFALLFSVVNILWAATMTVTVVRRYAWILVAYAAGMALMYAMARAAGPAGGPADLVLALAAGYALATLFLVGASVSALGIKPLPKAGAMLLEYASRYRNLALAGFFYSLATWVDKIVLAYHSGVAAPGTHFLVNTNYDSAFYYANLALIPGLVFFTVVTETEFSLDLRHLVVSLAKRRLPEIVSSSERIRRRTAANLAVQAAFQAAMVVGLTVAAPYFGSYLGFQPTIFIRILAAGFFQLLFLAGLTVLFYLELYIRAALAALVFAALDFLLSVGGVMLAADSLLGLPYLLSNAAAALLCLAFAFSGLRSFDQILFLRASGEAYGR